MEGEMVMVRQSGVASESAEDRMVHIERVFDAPRELVFSAWSSAERLGKWYAPHGCETTFHALDFREGGEFHSCVRTPGGHECWCKGVYTEIRAPERIVFQMRTCDANKCDVEPADVGMDPHWPKETTVVVTLEDLGGRTKLTLRQTVSETLAKKTGAYPSWLEMFDRLAGELKRV